LPDQWRESITIPIYKREIKLAVVIIMGYHCSQLHTTSSILLSKLSPYIYMTFFGIISVGIDVTEQLLMQILCTCQILEKELEHNETIDQLFVDFKKAYDSVRREVLNNILIQFETSQVG
jgi:hypothetical protein